MRAVHYLSILAIAGVFACCSKGDNGATGPMGPAGATGAMGATGATGANGTNGTNGAKGDTGAQGNANVIGQTFTANAWSYTSPAWSEDFTVTALTSAIVSKGAVEVYMSGNSGVDWYAMPYTVYGSIGNYIAGYSFGLNEVQVTWIYNSAGSGSSPSQYYGSTLVNVICIAPSMIKRYPNINWKNAAEVAQIPEVASVLKSMNN
jgi:hypothetical protein